MDKRYQVFVSSTYEDLQEERKEVMQALLELDCIPAGMELFPASNDDQWTLIKRVIDDSDYYLLIIGGRYGSTNEDGISYTQMEYEYARSIGKPIISFIRKNPQNIPAGKVENSSEGREKLEAFIRSAETKLVRFWETPAELGSVVSRSMIKLIKNYPAEGWIRSNSAIDIEAAKEIARLQKENRELYKIVHENDFCTSEEIQILAQGKDTFNVQFTVYFNESVTSKTDGITVDGVVFDYELTWETIFQLLGKAMLNATYESDIYQAFLAMITIGAIDRINEVDNELLKTHKIDRIELYPDVFVSILVQAAALGIIRRENDPFKGENKWDFTSYGEKEGFRMMAIKHKDSKATEE